jgi:hypothetical protein
MTRRALVLLLFVIAAMAAGFIAGYRLRISEEEVFYSDPSFKLPVPDDLASEYTGSDWQTVWP